MIDVSLARCPVPQLAKHFAQRGADVPELHPPR